MKYLLLLALLFNGCSSTLLTLDLSDNTLIVEDRKYSKSINFRGTGR